VQKDRALIKELGLNLKHVVSGAEPAQVARWTTLYKQHKPVIFYWYDPQYLNAIYDLYRVQLPKRFKGCIDDEKAKGNHACEYAGYPTLDKFVSSDFAKSGSPALKVVRKFKWTSADQNFVSTSSPESTWTRTRRPLPGSRRTKPRSTPGSSELMEAAGALRARRLRSVDDHTRTLHPPARSRGRTLALGPRVLPHSAS
jgi:hypothetical protein